ncbi:MAG: hypothetical protein J5762_04725 [Clostridia bacterium]|nr:hypothetical protein [Clostridia bacterium]
MIKSIKKSYTSFDPTEFSSPNAEFAPVYSRIRNAPVSKEETDGQLYRFVRLGIKAFYILPMLKDFRPTRATIDI